MKEKVKKEKKPREKLAARMKKRMKFIIRWESFTSKGFWHYCLPVPASAEWLSG